MTALNRLRQVSGLSSGSAGAALRSLAGASGPAGALLAGWSVLSIATAAQHLLSDGAQATARDTFDYIRALRVPSAYVGDPAIARMGQRMTRRNRW